MGMTPTQAMKQASDTANEYANRAIHDLRIILGIHQNDHERLAPYAPVIAAMITAATQDFLTALQSGVVDGFPDMPLHPRRS